jgi:hypothetical protein
MYKINCWDLDKTIGDFETVANWFAEGKPKEYEGEITLRPNIESVLKEFNKTKFLNILTTGGIGSYARFALKYSNLRKYFDQVFGREKIAAEIETELGYKTEKWYVPVALHYGYKEDLDSLKHTLPSNILVIGNDMCDLPVDVDLVAILFQFLETDSKVILPIVNKLHTEGSGNFSLGFMNLLEKSMCTQKIEENKKVITGRIEVDNIKLELNYEERNGAYYISAGENRCEVIFDQRKKKYVSILNEKDFAQQLDTIPFIHQSMYKEHIS